MKNKGTIIFFSVALAIVSLYHLSFTWKTAQIEDEAKAACTVGDDLDERRYKKYLDSMGPIEVYNLGIANYTYDECKQRELNLGLDLQGGMNMVVEITEADILTGMAGTNDTDPDFQKAIARAKKMATQEDGDFEDLFAKAMNEIAPGRSLATLFVTKDNTDQISYDSDNDEVVAYLKRQTRASRETAYEVIETRINQSNVSQPTLQRLDDGRLSIELPGVDNPGRYRKLITDPAQLEFWEVVENTTGGYQLLESINKTLAESKKLKEDSASSSENDTSSLVPTSSESLFGEEDTPSEKDSTGATDGLFESKDVSKDSTKKDTTQTKSPEELRKENPLFAYLYPAIDNQSNTLVRGGTIAITSKDNIDEVTKLLEDKNVRANIPSNIVFAWSAKPRKGSTVYELYALKGEKSGEAQLAGDLIVEARPTTNQKGDIEVLMKMNDFGTKEWAELTKKNVDKPVAVVLDGKVYTAPNVNGPIPNGISTIMGDFDIKEADFLANVLKAGRLPAPGTIVAEENVGPTLGADNTRKGLMSLLVGFLAVILFMVFYYNKGGIVADIAVLANVFLILGVLSAYGAALTLPGIAGIVLTIGMAVDANVLIFERIKEELSAGKTMKTAVSEGYKQALWSILDANITTLIAGFILASTGSGPVYGFAVILIIGIFSSLFTSLLFSRLIIEGRLAKGRSMSFSYSWSQNVLRNTNINFIGNRMKFYLVSGIIIVAGLIMMKVKPIPLGIDLKGGWSYQIQLDKDQDIKSETIKGLLDAKLEGSSCEVKTIGTDNVFKIVTSHKLNSDEPNLAAVVQNDVLNALSQYNLDSTHVLQSSQVGPTIAQGTRSKSTKRMIYALILMFAYIVIRFKKWGFGLGATIALFHDVLIVFAVYAILGPILPFALEIDQAFIAAILTVIGYSINDSVVVFDRVREYLRDRKFAKDTPSLINTAINDTLSRTVVTSLTTILVILILFLFGGTALKGFTFALLIGVIVGTYSSACIATPIVVDVDKLRKKKDTQPPSKEEGTGQASA